MNLKDKIYDFLVRKNENVRYEYERYVQEHLDEHYKHRIKHIKILMKLNWFYRVKRGNKPYLYQDKSIVLEVKPMTDTEKYKEKTKELKKGMVQIGPESKLSRRDTPAVLAKQLLDYDVISFDIFDTVILRAIEKPEDLFIFLEEENKIFDFANLRKSAERIVRENYESAVGSRDVTIDEIYNYIERETGIEKEIAIEKEFELEKKVCFANSYMLDVMDILKEQGKQIIFTSDMYYPKEMMQQLLNKCGIREPDSIYVSCDYRKSKRKGNLYRQIQKDFGRNISICHVGDNREVDIENAEKNGLKAVYYRNVNAIGRKNRPTDMSPLVKSIYSATVNTWIHKDEKVYSPQYEYGFIYGGIYVLGYVNWIHNFAQKNNIDKVIFLARDSDILKDIYDLRNADIESEYLYWGRLPSFKYMLKEDRYGFLKRNITDRVNRKSKITIGKVLQLLDLGELKKELKMFSLDENDILTKENANTLKAFLIKNIDWIEKKYDDETRIAESYVRKVIGKSKKIALVDIGWKGTEPLCLKRLITERWKIIPSVECLLAGSYGNKWNVQDGSMNVYMFSQVENVNNMKFLEKNVSYYTLAFELFGRMRCEARFRGFEIKEDRIKMNFEGNLVENHYDMEEMKKGIYDFVNCYIQNSEFAPWLMEISGFDAYAPSKLLTRDKKYLDMYFKKHKIELDAGDNEQQIRTYGKYIGENNF